MKKIILSLIIIAFAINCQAQFIKGLGLTREQIIQQQAKDTTFKLVKTTINYLSYQTKTKETQAKIFNFENDICVQITLSMYLTEKNSKLWEAICNSFDNSPNYYKHENPVNTGKFPDNIYGYTYTDKVNNIMIREVFGYATGVIQLYSMEQYEKLLANASFSYFF